MPQTVSNFIREWLRRLGQPKRRSKRQVVFRLAPPSQRLTLADLGRMAPQVWCCARIAVWFCLYGGMVCQV